MSIQHQINQYLSAFDENMLKSLRKLEGDKWHYYHEHGKKFQHESYPYGEMIVHPINPIFLHGLEGQELLERFDVMTVQDGFASLLQFFLKNPNPSTESVLLINQNLKNLIPRSWAKNCALYKVRLRADSFKNLDKRRKEFDSLYVYGMLNYSDTSLEILEKKIKFLKENYGEFQDKFKFLLFLRRDLYNEKIKDDTPDSFYILKEVFKEFGNDINLTTTEELFKAKDLSQSLFLNLGLDDLSFSYSNLDHFFLNNNASPANDKFAERINPEKTVIPLSPFHEIAILPFRYIDSALWDEFNKLGDLVGISKRTNTEDFFGFTWHLYQKFIST